MTVTITTWMILLNLGGWLFPGAHEISLQVEDPKDGPSVFFDTEIDRTRTLVMNVYEKDAAYPIGTLVRSKEGVMLGLGQAPRVITKALIFSEHIQNFSDLKKGALTTLKFTNGKIFKVVQSPNKVVFSGDDGKTYTLRAGAIPANQLLSKTGLTPFFVPKAGKMQGWGLFGAPMIITPKDIVTITPATAKDPARITLAFLSAWMRGDKSYTQFLSPRMDKSVRESLEKHAPELGKKIKSITLHGGLETGTTRKLSGDFKGMIKGMSRVFGAHDIIAFAEVNDKSNDLFILLDRVEETWKVHAVQGAWAKTLLPAKILKKMGR